MDTQFHKMLDVQSHKEFISSINMDTQFKKLLDIQSHKECTITINMDAQFHRNVGHTVLQDKELTGAINMGTHFFICSAYSPTR